MSTIKNYEEVTKIVAEEINGKDISFEVQEGGFMCRMGDTSTIKLTIANKSSFNGREEISLYRVTHNFTDENDNGEWEVSNSSGNRDPKAMRAFIHILKIAYEIQLRITKTK